MAAALALAFVDVAPGNAITLRGSGLTSGIGASVVLQNQGLVTPAPLALTASWDPAGESVTFTVPDGVQSAPLVVTAADATTATIEINVVSQYLQANAYAADGEGTDADVSQLADGVLDEILRDASAYVDATLGDAPLRLLQVQEDHRFSRSRRVWPFRNPRNRVPLVSLDALVFITSNAIKTSFTVGGMAPDVYVNRDQGYFEVQTYAVGNAILLGEIQTIGFSADVWRVTYTAGYPAAATPRAIRKATAIIATELLVYRGIIERGFGGLSKIKEGLTWYERRQEPFAIPGPAMALLRPFIPRSLR